MSFPSCLKKKDPRDFEKIPVRAPTASCAVENTFVLPFTSLPLRRPYSATSRGFLGPTSIVTAVLGLPLRHDVVAIMNSRALLPIVSRRVGLTLFAHHMGRHQVYPPLPSFMSPAEFVTLVLRRSTFSLYVSDSPPPSFGIDAVERLYTPSPPLDERSSSHYDSPNLCRRNSHWQTVLRSGPISFEWTWGVVSSSSCFTFSLETTLRILS